MIFTPIRNETELRERVVLGVTTEGLHLEFKRMLPEKGPEALEEAARDIAQFCNSWGGTLFFGVDEEAGPEGLPVAKAFVGTPASTKQRLLQAVANFCRPSDLDLNVIEIMVEGVLLVAVNIAPRERLVGVYDSPWIQYPFRTEHGKDYLRPEEIEERMNPKKRAVVIALGKAKNTLGVGAGGLVAIEAVVVPSPVKADNPDRSDARSLPGGLIAAGFGENELTLSGSSGQTLVVPFGLIDDAWVTVDRKLGLALNVSVVLRGGALFLER